MASAPRRAADKVTYTPRGMVAMSTQTNPTLQRQVDAEALRTVLSSSAVTTLPGVALAILTAVMLWPKAVPRVLIPWLIAVTASYAARAWFIGRYQRRARSGNEDVLSWRTGMIIHAAL